MIRKVFDPILFQFHHPINHPYSPFKLLTIPINFGLIQMESYKNRTIKLRGQFPGFTSGPKFWCFIVVFIKIRWAWHTSTDKNTQKLRLQQVLLGSPKQLKFMTYTLFSSLNAKNFERGGKASDWP